MSNSDQHRQVVKQLLETRAVDFSAVGWVIASKLATNQNLRPSQMVWEIAFR